MFGDRKKLVMCQACRGLIESSVKICPLCGRDSVPAAPARTLEKGGSPHFVSRLFLSINIALFVLVSLVEVTAGGGANSFLDGATQDIMLDFGALYGPAFLDGQWWRIITPNFLHFGVVHLLFNSLALYQIGPMVEDTYGAQKFILVYLATGVASMAASVSFGMYTVGASGSIYGLLGFLTVYGYRLGGTFGRAFMRQMLIWASVGIVIGFVMKFNNVAHIAGFLAGAALAWIISANEPRTERLVKYWNAVAIACAVIITISFVMVAVHYGSVQGGFKLSRRVDNARETIAKSFEWEGQSQESAQLATELRTAATDIQGIISIDQTSDAQRRLIVDLLNERARLFDGVQTDASAPVRSRDEHYERFAVIHEDYKKWERHFVHIYGFTYVPVRER